MGITREEHRRSPLGSGCGWTLFGLPLVLLLGVSLLALILKSVPSTILANLQSEEALSAIWVSLRTTTLSLALLMVLGTPFAYGLSKVHPTLRKTLEALITLPAVLPPSVAGIALLLAFGRMGLLGPWLTQVGIGVPFTAGAVVLAQLFVAAPFFLRPLLGAFRALDPDINEAAALDGAGQLTTFSRIALPEVWGQLVAAGSLAWARALGEFGATILFAGNRLGQTRTLPLAIYLGFESDLDQAVALSSLLLIVAAVVLVLTLLMNSKTKFS